jgi:pimeloyl-ACP methyl ester carboxylesterase
MDTNEAIGPSTYGRRQFLGAAGAATLAVGASQFGLIPKAEARSPAAAASARTDGPFGPVQQIDAGVLDIGYVEAGPADGTPVILMHGFPYDIHSFVEVAPLLAAAGYRVIVPYFRGHGATTFRSPRTPRDVDQAAFALDVLALMDALEIEKAILAGFDWGSRTGDIIAALWPQRCRALVSTTGYLITNLAANKNPLPAKAEWAWWYQYYFTTERGELGLNQYRRDLGELIWKFNSPTWTFSEATYEHTAAAFDNPDYVTIVIGNYRWRLGLAPNEHRYARIEKRLQQAPVIGVPTITIDGAYDPFTPAGDGSAYRAKFSGPYEHRTLPVGHNVPQEAPTAFANAVMSVDGLARR